jgi:hypothetical protein
MSTIVTRAGKGSPLTHAEVDSNFTNLNSDKVEASAGTLTNPSIAGVASFADGSASAPAITNTGDTNTGIFFPAADTIAFSEGGTEAMRLDSSGNLGIGVTPSAWAGQSATYYVAQAGGAAFYGIGTRFARMSANGYVDGAGTNRYIANGFATRHEQLDGAYIWATAPSGTAGNAITYTQRMTLTADGSLGLNATSPAIAWSGSATALQIVGTGSVAAGVRVSTANASAELFSSGSSTEWGLYSGSTAPCLFYTSGNERMRITSGGDLLVGATTLLPNANHFSYSAGNTWGVFGHDGGVASTTDFVRFNFAGSRIGSISQSGTTAVAYNTTSDYRLKDNQAPLTGSGAFIDALQPKTWTWTADGSAGVGFIAHEVQAVSPNSVVGEKDAVDEEGKPVMQAMEYGSAEFIANIIAELQDLRKRVSALENK